MSKIVDKDCGHSCSLTTKQCCPCSDTRPYHNLYIHYVDGKGYANVATREEFYCPSCKLYCKNNPVKQKELQEAIIPNKLSLTKAKTADSATYCLGSEVLVSILSFLDPQIRYFAMSTCSYWFFTIRNASDYVKVTPTLQMKLAAELGSIELIKHFLEMGYPVNETTCAAAAGGGQLECLKYLREVVKCPWNVKTSSHAARGGHMQCLEYAISQFCSFDSSTYAAAAKGGHLECLQYLVGRWPNQCEWDDKTCANASGGGHINCLQYAHENGCPWKESAIRAAAKGGHLECLQYLFERWIHRITSDLILDAIEGSGSLECLRYLHRKGLILSISHCNAAARLGLLDCLKYLKSKGCKWSKATASIAVREGQLEILHYLKLAKCPWNSDTSLAALEKGDLEILKFLRENNCPFPSGPHACEVAATYGHLEVLKYLHENGFLWDRLACHRAANQNHLECLKYLHENGCPWSHLCYSGIPKDSEVSEYLLENGCPADFSGRIFAPPSNNKRVVEATSILETALADIKSGIADSNLMQEYITSALGLLQAYKKLE